MSNNLERHIAVVTNVGGKPGAKSKVVELLSDLECTPRFFEPATLLQINAAEFDGILFDDVAIEHGTHIEKTLREFHADFKPIAVTGRSSHLVLKIFGSDLELAMNQNTLDEDYVSDRDFKVLSTSGKDARGINRMLRELIEMA